MVQAYCVKCRAKTDIKDPKEVKLKNGRPAVKAHVQLVELTYSVLAQCQKNRWKLFHLIPLFQKQYREYPIRFFYDYRL